MSSSGIPSVWRIPAVGRAPKKVKLFFPEFNENWPPSKVRWTAVNPKLEIRPVRDPALHHGRSIGSLGLTSMPSKYSKRPSFTRVGPRCLKSTNACFRNMLALLDSLLLAA